MKPVNMTQPDRIQSLLAKAHLVEFSGWDLSWLNGPLIQDETPWDYSQKKESLA